MILSILSYARHRPPLLQLMAIYQSLFKTLQTLIIIVKMSNLNILVGVIYTALIIIEFLVIKNLFHTKSEYIDKLVRQQNGPHEHTQPQHNNQQNQLTFKMILGHFLKMHPFGRCCNRHFPLRSYELLVFCIIVNILVCGESIEKLVYSVPIVAVSDLVLLAIGVAMKQRSKNRLKGIVRSSVNQRSNFTVEFDARVPEHYSNMAIKGKLGLKGYVYEIVYMGISTASLVAIGSKFYQMNHEPFQAIPGVQLIGISVAVELIVLRPVTLTIIGFIITALTKSTKFEQLRQQLRIAATTDYEQIHLRNQKEKQRLQQLNIKSSLAHRRSQLRLQDLHHQQTEQQINAPSLQQRFPTNQTHTSPLQNIILITRTQQTHETSPDQQQHISPVKINSPNLNFGSKTVKKEVPPRRNQTANEAINEIQQFKIEKKEEGTEEPVISDNYRTKKGEGLETAIGTSTESALEGVRKRTSEGCLNPLQEIEFNCIERVGLPISTKALYGMPNIRRQGERIIGNIIDDETVKDGIEQKEGCTTQPPRKKKSRNKKIHVIYTQESSDGEHGESRSHSAGTRSRMGNHQILIGDEKENQPTSSFTNTEFNHYYNSKSIQMPVLNPMDMLLIRCNRPDQPEETNDDVYERRKRKRRSRKTIEQQPIRQKSPYLQFLPKMLRKEQLERNQSCIVEPRPKLTSRPAAPPTNPSRNSKKQQCMQLQIIKKTISSEIDTVYT